MSSSPTIPFPETRPVEPQAPEGTGQMLLRRARQAVMDAAYLIVGLVTGTAFFSIVVTLGSLSASLMILIVGVPIAMISSEILRWCADVDRYRARLVDSVPIHGVYRPMPPGVVEKARTMVTDGRRWRDVGYHLIQFPVSVAGFCVAVTAWSASLALLFCPLYYWTIPDGSSDALNVGVMRIDTLPEALLMMVVGALLVPIAYGLCRAAVVIAVGLTRLLLGDDQERMQARISHLEETRSGAVDASSSELRRIERDLHDGAQARMVSVAMDLGMAEERMAHDPEGARELVQGARAEARRALAEMRDLVRGIAPSVLADRGLDAALGSLVGRAPVPVLLEVDLPERPSSSAEVAAYFVVSESLANVGKHAAADSCEIDVRRVDDDLVVRITDDGVGGAGVENGGGLAGLRDRVAALDGTLLVTSPAGGPTTIEARIPCGS